MKPTNKVAIYVRVSTTSQVDEGYSIDEQKAKLTSYCDIKDWSIYEIYTDGGFSGSNTERPALEQLIRDAKRKLFDTVLVYKLDRLSRSQKDTLYLIEDVFLENNIEFVSLLENFDTSLKAVERKEDVRRVLDTKDIFTLDYEQQKAIARALISKVRVTSESIVILWKL